MSEKREDDETTLINLIERREGELDLFQEPSISTDNPQTRRTQRSRRKRNSGGRKKNTSVGRQ